jgi:hypothetical protein
VRPAAAMSRSRFLLLFDLRRQLPKTRGTMRGQTERAIYRLEVELAGGRGVAGRKATK